MSVTTETTAAQVDYLAMSDEEIMNAVASVEPVVQEPEQTEDAPAKQEVAVFSVVTDIS